MRITALAPLFVLVSASACGGSAPPDLDAGGSGDAARLDARAGEDATVEADAPVGIDADCPAADEDDDGHASLACAGDDCDDSDANRFPGNPEVCDAADHDEDCDPSTFGDRDADGDGHVAAECCNGSASGPECGDDCDDTQLGVHPGSPEVCNLRDDDCDAAFDEGVRATFYADCDDDGFGGTESVVQCAAPATPPATCPGALWIGVGDDCDDADDTTHPGATETCNANDDDCDGTDDDGGDAWCAGSLPHTATASCTAGACASLTCAGAYLDCSSAPGCESDGATDPDHCGSCTTFCSWGCRASSCDDAVEVRAGGVTTCVRRESGHVVCWGSNNFGQVGDGTTTFRTRATPVSGLTDATQIAVGVTHACAVRAGGTIVCWGNNDRGQLGTGTMGGTSTVPVAVVGITSAVEVAASELRTCARLASGSVMCWGAAGVGALGDGTTTDRLTPVMVSGMTNAISIATGRTHTCAVRATGSVACWGANSSGQIGDGTTTARTTPTAVSMITNARGVVAGDSFTCVYLTTGGVRCWGQNGRGQLGDGTTTTSLTPVTTMSISGVTQLATAPMAPSQTHVCALSGDAVRCWGANDLGQLGDGTTMGPRTTPGSPILLLGSFVAAAHGHSCAIQEGIVVCWGENGEGRLGDGTTDSQTRPVRALPP